jgi:hypothetical protein
MNIAEKLTTIAENEQKVYESGKKAEYDRFWDNFQNNGTRTDYNYGFNNWEDECIYPKYDMKPKTSERFLYVSTIKNLKQRLVDCGVILDFSSSTTVNNMFAYCYQLEELPELNLSSRANNGHSIFRDCKKLHTIDKIILGDRPTATYTQWFGNCTALQNVTFDRGNPKSELITRPFNECFIKHGTSYLFSDAIVNDYSDYFYTNMGGGAAQYYRSGDMYLETGEVIKFGYLVDTGIISLPKSFVPDDETQEVSFYLQSANPECIGNDLDMSACPLSKDSIISVITSLSASVSGKTLKLKKTAVNTAFEIDVDNEDTWSFDYLQLVHSRSNWTFSYV